MSPSEAARPEGETLESLGPVIFRRPAVILEEIPTLMIDARILLSELHMVLNLMLSSLRYSLDPHATNALLGFARRGLIGYLWSGTARA